MVIQITSYMYLELWYPEQTDQITGWSKLITWLADQYVYVCLCWGFTAQSTQWGHVERGQFT